MTSPFIELSSAEGEKSIFLNVNHIVSFKLNEKPGATIIRTTEYRVKGSSRVNVKETPAQIAEAIAKL